MTLTLLVTDADLAVVGDPITTWTKLDAEQRFNAPAPGVVVLPATPAIAAQIQAGHSLVLIRDGQVFSAGPIEEPDTYDWEVGGGSNAEPGTLEVAWTDDLVHIAARLVYPDPTAVATAQTTVESWTGTGNAETLMRSLVDAQCGPGALAARQVPHLALGAVASVGSSISYTSRFEPMGDALRSIASAGGGLGFRTTRSTSILFEVYQPRDLSASVRFSRSLRNLRSVSYQSEAPTVTRAIVAGQGEGTARTFVEVADETAEALWSMRVEQFIDQRQTNDTTELTQAGAEALAAGAARYRLVTETVDTEMQSYGASYGLGDQVTVEVRPGLDVVDVVRAVKLTHTPDEGEQITALIGSSEASTDPAWALVSRELHRRLSGLERR